MASSSGKACMKDLSLRFDDGTVAAFSVDQGTYDAVVNRGDKKMLETLKKNYQEALAEITHDTDQNQTIEQATESSICNGPVSRCSTPTSVSSNYQWSRPAILKLLQLWEKFETDFSSPKTKKKAIWQKIAEQLCEDGFYVNHVQAESKWKNLTKKYRDIVDHNNISGNDRKTCPFFDELSDIYGYKPNVNPTATSSTLGPVTSTPKRKINNDSSDNSEEASTSSSANAKKGSKKSKYPRKAKTNNQAMVDAIQKIHEEQKEADEKKQEIADRMNREKLAMFGEFLNILKERKQN